MKTFINNFLHSLIPALPLGDDIAISKVGFNVVPLKGQSAAKSSFQKELETLHAEGKWKPKISLLPDVGKFEIKLKAYNAALLANGLLSRYPSEVTLYKNRNRKMNRYLVYMYWRLSQSQGQAKYWDIAINFIRNSSTYMTVCIHTVDRNMYRKMNQRDMYKLFKRLNAMRANMFLKDTKWGSEVMPLKAFRHYMKYYRVYIPKGTNTYRPLGVPVRAWRIYQKMWLMPIVGFTGHLIPNEFHGYIPKRGVGTAWQTILTQVIHQQNIYEVDFRQFFPSVPTMDLSVLLFYKAGMPGHIVQYLHLMNQSLPMFMDQFHLLPETEHTEGSQRSLFVDQLKLASLKPKVEERLINGLRSTGIRSHYMQTGVWPKGVDTQIGAPIGYQQFTADGQVPYSFYYDPTVLGMSAHQLEEPENFLLSAPVNYYDIYSKNSTLRDKSQLAKAYKVTFEDNIPGGIGLPQGGPLSPYLSILYLEMVMDILGKPEDVHYLFYADDGMFYSDNFESLDNWLKEVFRTEPLKGVRNDFFHGTFKKFNINIHPEKSGYVRKEGEWLKPLKFLGLQFEWKGSFADSTLRAATRPKLRASGQTTSSDLAFTKSNLVFYDYSMSHIQDAANKAKQSKSFAVYLYWSTLAKLVGLSRTALDYLYLVSRIATEGAHPLILFILSRAYLLENSGTLYSVGEELLDRRESAYTLRLSDLPHIDKENIEKVAYFLEAGYENAELPKSATENLIKRLEKGASSVYPVTGVTQVEDNTDKVLFSILNAPIFFGLSIKESFDYAFRYERVKGKPLPTPIDLLRFFNYVGVEYFWPYVYPAKWKASTKDLSSKRSAHEEIQQYSETHKFANLAASKYYGLIISRMFQGSWFTERVEQNFTFTSETASLADFLETRSTKNELNVFVGSSYATHEMVRLLSHLKRSSRTQLPFHLFSEGFLKEGSWESNLDLSSPSLASEFPGAKEPHFP